MYSNSKRGYRLSFYKRIIATVIAMLLLIFNTSVRICATPIEITFDLAYGNVIIGSSYSGYNSDNELISGSHIDTNKYRVTQSNTGITPNTITLVGNSDKPTYDVTIDSINCASDTNKSAGGIIANAVSTTPMNIILRLAGDNYVGRVQYATGGAAQTSVSSFTITSASGDGNTDGSLTAYSSVPWSAAIGGIDDTTLEASRNIYINGGTINAETSGTTYTGTSAIGGGGNGYSDVTITGGNITAVNCGTGATIGGGGGRGLAGGGGYVIISGGTVNATNNYVNGVAIGGGGSLDSTGSLAEVTISGGNITANGSIGGGYSEAVSGGTATVNISGGWIITNKSICGGNSVLGTGGSVSVTITGGTVVAPRITGGFSSATGTYNDATVSIAGASVNIGDRSNINSVTGPDPFTKMEAVVYSQTINISSLNGFNGSSSDVNIQNAKLSDGNTYSLEDVYTDEEGNAYFWLPTEYNVTNLTIGGIEYDVINTSQPQIATITHNSSTFGSILGAVLNYGTATAWQWEKSSDGDTWESIVGENSSIYLIDSDDLSVSDFIRVVITTAAGSITSGSLCVSSTPCAKINYTTLNPGSTLTAELLNPSGGITYQYRWQRYVDNSWTNIASATETSYVTGVVDNNKQLRVVISNGTNSYFSTYVFVHDLVLTVTIPESITLSSENSSFSITGSREYFASSQSITVKCSGDFTMELTGVATVTLGYTLYKDDRYTNTVYTGNEVATFTGNGISTVPLYYSIDDPPVYAGTYTDTLTFTVTLNSP